MFKIACGLRERAGWELSPSEFWAMSPAEWWLLYDINVGNENIEAIETKERLLKNFKILKARDNEHNKV